MRGLKSSLALSSSLADTSPPSKGAGGGPVIPTSKIAGLLVGDSRLNAFQFDAYPATTFRNRSNAVDVSWAISGKDQAFLMGGNFARGGKTSLDYMDTAGALNASNAGWKASAEAAVDALQAAGYLVVVYIKFGVNDIGTILNTVGAGGTSAQIAQRLMDIAAPFKAKNCYPIIALDTGADTVNGSSPWTSAEAQRLFDLNAAIRSNVAADTGTYKCRLVDLVAIANATQTSTVNTFKSYGGVLYAYDTDRPIHPSTRCADDEGTGHISGLPSLYDAITSIATPIPERPAGTELLTNLDFATATGGNNGTGVTSPGGVPAGWRTVRDNSNVDSITFTQLGGGKCRVAMSANTSLTGQNGCRFRQDPSIAGLVAGDKLEGWGKFTLQANPVNLCDLSMEVTLNYSDTTFEQVYGDRAGTLRGGMVAESDREFYFRTGIITVNPAKTLASINFSFRGRFEGAGGSATFDMFAPSLRKVA